MTDKRGLGYQSGEPGAAVNRPSAPANPSSAAHTTSRMVFSFELAGEKWNWPVEGDDGIRAFRELLMLARVPYTVRRG